MRHSLNESASRSEAVGLLSERGSELGLVRRAVAWLMKGLDHFASFEDRRKAFISSASLSFSVPTQLQEYAYGASRSPVSLPHPPDGRYTTKNVRAIIPEETGKPTGEEEKHQDRDAAQPSNRKGAEPPRRA